MLACPTTLAESQLLGTLSGNRGQDYWIGANDILREGQWDFPCGVANYSFPWCPGEPNNGGGGIRSGGDCVRIIGRSAPGNGNCPTGGWADFRCDTPQDNDRNPIGFVCEINSAKQEAWWDDDDDDEGEAAPGGGAGGGANGPAIFFAVVGCLGCAASLVALLTARLP